MFCLHKQDLEDSLSFKRKIHVSVGMFHLVYVSLIEKPKIEDSCMCVNQYLATYFCVKNSCLSFHCSEPLYIHSLVLE